MLDRPRIRLKRMVARERNHWAYNRQQIDPPGRPAVFQVELTNHCPMRCEMCPRTHRMSRPLGYMARAVYERIIDQAAGSTSKVFLHHFGDSLVHPEIGPYIAYAASRGIGTYLSANPVLLTPGRIRALVDNHLTELVLSLDGITGETSAAVRGKAAGNVALAEQRVRALLDYRREVGTQTPHVIMQIVRQRQNKHEVNAWLRKWRAVDGVDQVKVKSYIAWDGRDEAIERLRPEPRLERAPVACDKPWSSVTVLWDGTVVPCCFDFDGLLALGDLARESLAEIWHGERAKALRRAHRDGDLSSVTLCAKCKDKEGYPVRKWFYPANRLLQRSVPLGEEWNGEESSAAPDPCST
jgi:radical SAM protein with 4Fe4S-binding SPASM domain